MSEHMNEPRKLSKAKLEMLKAAFEKTFAGPEYSASPRVMPPGMRIGFFGATPTSAGGPTTPVRRLALLRLTPELVLSLLTSLRPDPSGRLHLGIPDATLPDGCAVVNAGYDCDRHAFVLTLEHPSFRSIPEGCMIPELTPTLTAAEAKVVSTQPANRPAPPQWNSDDNYCFTCLLMCPEMADSARLKEAIYRLAKPNPEQTWDQLFCAALADLRDVGACHLWFPAGKPEEVRRLPPARLIRFGSKEVAVICDEGGEGYIPTAEVESFDLGSLQREGPAEPMAQKVSGLKERVYTGTNKRTFTFTAPVAIEAEPLTAPDDSWGPPPVVPAAPAAPPPDGCPQGHDQKEDPCRHAYCRCPCGRCRAQCDAGGY